MEKAMSNGGGDEVAFPGGRDVRVRPLLIWFGFSAMSFCAAQLLHALPLSKGPAAGGSSPARLFCAYVAWLLALVAVLSAAAFRRLPRAVAHVVDRALMVRAAPLPLVAVCTANLLLALADAGDDAARLVGAYAVWLLVLVAALAPVAGFPPRAVSAVLLAAVVCYFLQY